MPKGTLHTIIQALISSALIKNTISNNNSDIDNNNQLRLQNIDSTSEERDLLIFKELQKREILIGQELQALLTIKYDNKTNETKTNLTHQALENVNKSNLLSKKQDKTQHNYLRMEYDFITYWITVWGVVLISLMTLMRCFPALFEGINRNEQDWEELLRKIVKPNLLNSKEMSNFIKNTVLNIPLGLTSVMDNKNFEEILREKFHIHAIENDLVIKLLQKNRGFKINFVQFVFDENNFNQTKFEDFLSDYKISADKTKIWSGIIRTTHDCLISFIKTDNAFKDLNSISAFKGAPVNMFHINLGKRKKLLQDNFVPFLLEIMDLVAKEIEEVKEEEENKKEETNSFIIDIEDLTQISKSKSTKDIYHP